MWSFFYNESGAREENGEIRDMFSNDHSNSKNRRNLRKMTCKADEPVRGYFNSLRDTVKALKKITDGRGQRIGEIREVKLREFSEGVGGID